MTDGEKTLPLISRADEKTPASSVVKLRLGIYFLILLITMSVCGSALYALHCSLLPRIEKDELKAVRNSVQIVLDQLEAQMQVGRTKAESLGMWDEAYTYTSDPAQHDKIEEVLLTDASLATSDFSIIIWLDAKGNLIYGRKRDPETGVYGPLPEAISSSIKLGSPLFPDDETVVRGFTTMNNRPGFVISQPVVPHTYSGRSSGRIIGWFMVKQSDVAALNKLSGLRLELACCLRLENDNDGHSGGMNAGRAAPPDPHAGMHGDLHPGMEGMAEDAPAGGLWANQEPAQRESLEQFDVSITGNGPAYDVRIHAPDVQHPKFQALKLEGKAAFSPGASALEIRNYWVNFTLIVWIVLFLAHVVLVEFFFIRPLLVTNRKLRDILTKGKPQAESGLLSMIGPEPFRQLEATINDLFYRAALESEKHVRSEKTSQAKSEFLSVMSHEIRDQLNVIHGFSYLMLQRAIQPKQKEPLEKIYNAAERLLGIITDIMDYASLDSGTMTLESAPFALDDIMGALAGKYRQQCLDKGLEFIFGVPPEIPQNLVGDGARLLQVLSNLVSNAIKYTVRGEVFIGCSVEQRERERVCLNFTIRDTGIGIPANRLENIFEGFRQHVHSHQSSYSEEGNGIGLAIAHQIVTLMGGSIKVRSIVDKGTKVSVTCCFDLDDTPVPRRLPEAWRGMRVLVADDNYSNRMAFYDMLTGLGFEPELAESGNHCIEQAVLAQNAGRPYPVLLLDQVMPDMNGFEVSKKIYALPSIKNKPAVILTSAFNPPSLAAMQEANISVFLAKPANCSLLAEAMLTALPGVGGASANYSDNIKKTVRKPYFSNSRVLLVEDNPVNEQIALEMLAEVGIQAEVAHTGREALDKVQNADQDGGGLTSPYDLVFMDIQMPEMDGLAATRILRKNSNYNGMPIVAMTAHALAEERESCLAAGMNEHLSKPVELDRLYAVLRQFLRDESGNAPERQPQETPDGLPALTPADAPAREAAAFEAPPVEEDSENLRDGISMLAILAGLEGFDSQTAMQNLNYDRQLYRKILYRFWQQYSPALDELERAVASGDINAALDMAHNVRGLAGNMGNKFLEYTAGNLEDICRETLNLPWRDGKPVRTEAFTMAYANFVNAMNRALSSLGKVFNVE